MDRTESIREAWRKAVSVHEALGRTFQELIPAMQEIEQSLLADGVIDNTDAIARTVKQIDQSQWNAITYAPGAYETLVAHMNGAGECDLVPMEKQYRQVMLFIGPQGKDALVQYLAGKTTEDETAATLSTWLIA
jgi:hypothetical protein